MYWSEFIFGKVYRMLELGKTILFILFNTKIYSQCDILQYFQHRQQFPNQIFG
jgi:hypothetical protein